MKELNNEALNVTSDQLSKDASLKNYMKSPDGKKTDINIVDKNKPNSATATNSTSPTTTTLEEDAMVDAQPQLKKLSKLYDKASGQVSQPFVIGGKQYQMVRAMNKNRQEVQGVEDMTDGNIYEVEDFDRNIATPARDMEQGPIPSIDPPMHKMQEDFQNQQASEQYIDYLNLSDMKGYKDFFVNPKTGEVVAKFKNARDMIKSGTKLEEDHDYMDAKQLRRLRFSNSMKSDEGLEEDVNLGKLQNDVKKLSKLIKDKFMIALEKINTPLEQSQFLVAMANEIGVPFSKLTSIINSFKDISKDQDTMNSMTSLDSTTDTSTGLQETRVITKNQLVESIKPSNKIKIKDIRNGRL
jgi:hypothetical protein